MGLIWSLAWFLVKALFVFCAFIGAYGIFVWFMDYLRMCRYRKDRGRDIVGM